MGALFSSEPEPPTLVRAKAAVTREYSIIPRFKSGVQLDNTDLEEVLIDGVYLPYEPVKVEPKMYPAVVAMADLVSTQSCVFMASFVRYMMDHNRGKSHCIGVDTPLRLTVSGRDLFADLQRGATQTVYLGAPTDAFDATASFIGGPSYSEDMAFLKNELEIGLNTVVFYVAMSNTRQGHMLAVVARDNVAYVFESNNAYADYVAPALEDQFLGDLGYTVRSVKLPKRLQRMEKLCASWSLLFLATIVSNPSNVSLAQISLVLNRAVLFKFMLWFTTHVRVTCASKISDIVVKLDNQLLSELELTSITVMRALPVMTDSVFVIQGV